jgi:peptidoglycan/xylan/chitin deacetylase (PgdA/CDA1 family)
VAFLREFVQILKAGGYHVVTYEQINADPSITAREQGRLFIITIDDVPLCTNMDPSLPEMFAILEEAGYPAVLGVITQGERALDSAIDTLTRLHGLGWELAAHGDTHRNLLTIQQESPGEVFWEIKACLDKMESFLGVRPHTLILPEGQMIEDPHYIANNEIQWVVGITGGEMYDSTDGLSYVGRMGPNLTAEHTFELLVKRFSP